jgi:hypothetical protein
MGADQRVVRYRADTICAQLRQDLDRVQYQCATADLYIDDVVLLARSTAPNEIFASRFEPPGFRGTNLAGMEMDYAYFTAANGPVGNTNYSVYDTGLIDYFASKHISTFRFLFSWKGMQATLGGPIPTVDTQQSGTHYQDYFNNYKSIVDYATGWASRSSSSLGRQIRTMAPAARAGVAALSAPWPSQLRPSRISGAR